MKNGEEIVSVGGVMEPSTKNMGISASNSVLLDLSKVSCQPIKLSNKLSQLEVRVIVSFSLRMTRSGFNCCEVALWKQPTEGRDTPLFQVIKS